MEYHVTFGKQEKVIYCSGSLIDGINNSFGEHFAIEDLEIKKWNTKWFSWVDTTYENASSMEMRIKLTVKENPSYNETSYISTSYNALYGDPNVSAPFEDHQITDCSTPTNSQGDAGQRFSILTGSSNDCSTPTNQRDAGQGSSSLVVGASNEYSSALQSEAAQKSSSVVDQPKKLQKPWPCIFPVPEMPWQIIGKSLLTKKDIKIVVEYMFHTMSSFKMYPTSHQYTEATKALLEKYPQLTVECPGKSPMEFWKVRILDKFRNERKRNFPEGAFSPQKRKPAPHKINPKVFSTDGEDEDSLNYHKEWMKKEYGKKEYDVTRVKKLMDVTACLRSFPQQKLQISFAEFPFLKDPNELILEVKRFHGIDMMHALKTNMEKLPEGLRNDLSGKDKMESLMLQVPVFLKENVDSVFLEQEIEVAAPTIICVSSGGSAEKEKFKVLAEGEVIFENVGSVLAVGGFLALHVIFNLEYHKKTATIAAFEMLFGLKCSIHCKKRKFVILANNLK